MLCGSGFCFSFVLVLFAFLCCCWIVFGVVLVFFSLFFCWGGVTFIVFWGV